MTDDDDETTETTLWRRTVERLLASGSSPGDALDGANLILQAYRRQREATTAPVVTTAPVATTASPLRASAAPPIDAGNPARASGVRRRINSKRFRAK